MKHIVLATLILSSFSFGAEFPITKVVEVTKIEVWPSNEGQGKYAA